MSFEKRTSKNIHLYIHIPFCEGKCHYCGFYSVTAWPSLVERYSDAPAIELARRQTALPEIGHVSPRTIYIGGGTPAMLGCDGIKRLVGSLSEHLSLDAVEEWTVELNPASATAGFLTTLAALGVTRISIGVQSFDAGTLARIGRRHTAEEARQAVKKAQDAGFSNTGIDLIAGLPGATSALWEETLGQTLSLGLAHVSVYALTLDPGTPLAAEAGKGLALPDDDAQLAALAQAETLLGRGGFSRYEISNYALPGRECRHNLSVWRGGDYLGLGPAAASRIGRQRWTNSADIHGYLEALGGGATPPGALETLDEHGDAAERAMFALRLAEGIDPAADSKRFPSLKREGWADRWETKLAGLARHGITERGGRRWRLTSRGREVCDAVLRELI